MKLPFNVNESGSPLQQGIKFFLSIASKLETHFQHLMLKIFKEQDNSSTTIQFIRKTSHFVEQQLTKSNDVICNPHNIPMDLLRCNVVFADPQTLMKGFQRLMNYAESHRVNMASLNDSELLSHIKKIPSIFLPYRTLFDGAKHLFIKNISNHLTTETPALPRSRDAPSTTDNSKYQLYSKHKYSQEYDQECSGNPLLHHTLYNYRYIKVHLLIVDENNPFVRLICELRLELQSANTLVRKKCEVLEFFSHLLQNEPLVDEIDCRVENTYRYRMNSKKILSEKKELIYAMRTLD
ncbi:hypothetical protein RFI_32243 [Reticulomyxa filosa]|uniref:Uncharacterized protein n=1 Tax=Reticulomyxa filosa TaxID=46433 RepID=X6LT92_RETFI|nr:hypothetical protein RFI_32243 [Reticulomyxa filosa]|eukprot:ETO05153.1 hypothetical protein RFI_32243 [Reticulomyxa filosa]